jgi:hypothetical protein
VCCEQERPCTRCIKRNIGHLCHDEPRDQESKKSKSLAPSTIQETGSQPDLGPSALDQNAGGTMRPPSFDSAMTSGPAQAAKAAFDAAALASRNNNPLQLVQPTPVSGIPASTLGGMSQCRWLEHPRGTPSVSESRRKLKLPFCSCRFLGRLAGLTEPLPRHAQLPPQLCDRARGDQ